MRDPTSGMPDLSVSFGGGEPETRAVKNVSFEIAGGETLALVGESGSGKSVTALSIMQLLPYPTALHPSGSIMLEGEELVGAPPEQMQKVRGNRVAIIFQEPLTSLNPLHSIEKQLVEILFVHKKMDKEAARARIIELLDEVGLPNVEERLSAYPHQLSGGQRQRVMIAMALANDPDLLIADEPTTALDVTVQKQILRLTDIEVAAESEAAFGLLGAAARAAEPYLRTMLADKASIDLKPFAANAKTKIEAAMADFRGGGDGVNVDLGITDIRLVGVAFDNDTLRVITETAGTANVTVTALPTL